MIRKHTTRVLTYNARVRVEPTLMRTILRDAHGQEHVVEQSIDLPVFEQRMWYFADATDETTEAYMLGVVTAHDGVPCVALETRDDVTIEEIPDPEPVVDASAE